MKRKCLTILLTVLMSMVGMNSFAQFSGLGAGTADDPYRITNAVQLNEVRNNLDKAFILMNDINLTGYLYDESPYLGWLPIGDSSSPFTGSFNGNNMTISGLFIVRGTTDCVGLFGKCMGSIENLTLKDVYIKGQKYVGAISGLYEGKGSITNCNISGISVEGTDNVGGCIGYCINDLADNTIQNISLISSNVDVIGTNNVGGLFGQIRGFVSLSSCFVQGSVSGKEGVGGIIGQSEHTSISDCGFNGNVSGEKYLGGIAGRAPSTTSFSLERCFSFVTITCASTSDGYVGGLFGSISSGNVSNCFCKGSVSGSSITGGLFGSFGGKIEKCYFEGEVSGTGPKVGGLIGSTSQSSKFYSNNVSLATSVASSNDTPKRVIGYIRSVSGAADNISQCKAYNRMVVIANGSVMDLSTIEDSKLNGTGVGATTLKQKSTYSSMGWDLTNVWAMSDGEGYPYLIGSTQRWLGDLKDVSSLTISPIATVTYNGSEQTPAVTVLDGNTTLTNGTDYTVSYSNNINAGTATVTITGMGNYTGTKTTSFKINAKSVSSLTISSIPNVSYNGLAQTPTVTVIDGSTALINGTDYTVSYSNNINAGTATVTITGMGNYTGTKTTSFQINVKSASYLTISSITPQVYTGSAVTPTVTVKDGTTTLTNGTDYTVSYSNNINVGTATVTVTGKGNYTGTTTATFTIYGRNAMYFAISSIANVTYSGLAQTPAVTVLDGSTILTNGTDYTVSYSNNINVGTATVTVTGKGNYTGTTTTTFTIQKASLSVTAKSYTIVQGDPLPTFEADYSGFKNNETKAVLTKQPIFTCEATATSGPGEYTINVSGAEAENYDISYVAGKLTITEENSGTEPSGPNNPDDPNPQTTVEVTDISTMNNVIYIEPMEGQCGTQATISLKMKNSAAIRGFQFDLYLPEGVTVVKSSKGKIQGFLSEDRLPDEDEHTLTFSEQSDGAIRFLCSSQYEETFRGNDGEIVTLKVNIADNMEDGEYPIQLKNMKLTENNISNFYETALVQSKLTISSYVVGDISGDGVVDVSDYTGVANHIHGNTPEGFNAKAADVDGNNVIDVSDYTGIANIIHTGSIYGNSSNAPAMMLSPRKVNTDISDYDNVIYISPFTASAGTQTTISIKMKNAVAIRGFQFDLHLPEGMTVVKSAKGRIQGALSAGRLPDEDEHELTFSEQSDGSIRFLCSSQYDETFTGNDGEIATLQVNVASNMANGDYPIQLTDMKLTETDISKYYTADLIETTVTIGEVDTRVILDETSTTAPEAASNVDVRVKRTINANEWSTICLPFAMTAEQVTAAFGSGVKLGDLSSWESVEENDAIVAINVNFTDVTAIAANHPYIIKVTSPITYAEGFTVDGVDIAPVAEPKVQVGTKASERGWMYGTYVAGGTVPEENLFLSGSKFWYSKGLTTIKAFRGYFKFRDVLDAYYDSDAAPVFISFDGGTTSLSEELRVKNEEFAPTDNYYTLDGRLVKTPTKGVYIHNGKKVVIK